MSPEDMIVKTAYCMSDYAYLVQEAFFQSVQGPNMIRSYKIRK